MSIHALRRGFSMRRLRYAAVPVRTVSYLSTQTDTANATTSTFSGVSIGTPHPKRIVVLAVFNGVQATASATLNGCQPISYQSNESGTTWNSVFFFLAPIGTTADITISVSGSARKACSVYVFYPRSPFMMNKDFDTKPTTSDATGTLTTMPGSALFYAGAQLNSLSTFTTTWSGTESVIEDVDAQIEATSTYTAGHIDITSTTFGTLTLSASVSNTKHLSVMTVGACY